MSKTVIVDYDAGNLRSVSNMLSFLGVRHEITSEKNKILDAQRIIFPGQGHFAQAMANLEKKGLAEVIKECCKNDVPFLGICIGLQILFEKSEESPNTKGLSVFKGEVKKFRHGKIPQIGWNKISAVNSSPLFKDDYFYFVNSYYVVPEDESIISSYCDYNGKFCASVQKGKITAVQFHPEKSSKAGLEFFKNWLELNS